MSALVNNVIALKILNMLVTPFDKTDAFRLHVIDSDGNLLVQPSKQTSDQKASYDYLTRLVFNMKRILGKFPGGKSSIASFTAALFLIREQVEHDYCFTDADLTQHMKKIESAIVSGIIPVEESLEVEQFLEDGEPPTNNTSGVAITQLPITSVKRRKHALDIELDT